MPPLFNPASRKERGALLACTLLIPLIGVWGVCVVTAVLNIAGGSLVLLRYRSRAVMER